MTETVELSRQTVKKILRLYIDATDLLEEIPKLQDQGRLSEASQHIGAELEARVTEMNECEKDDPVLRELLEEISNDQINENSSLSELEKEVLD